MKVFVTGGTGAIGGHAVPALVAAGHDVAALARGPAKAEALAQQGATPISVSIFDRAALRLAFAGQDAVVNLATAIPPGAGFLRAKTWATNDRIRSQGSAAVVDAALDAGVGRVVQESVCMLYRDHGNSWVGEDAPTDDYRIAKGNIAAESSANRFSRSGGIGVVLRFGWFYGPGARHSEQMLTAARHHVALVPGPSATFLSSIHMADAGTAVVAALEAPAGAFNVVDDEPLTKREYAQALSRAAGKALCLRLPGRSAALLGDRLTSLTRSLRVSNQRFKSATGWAPRYPSAREGWLAAAAALAVQQRTARPEHRVTASV